jgi:hypothetical protein
MSSRLRDPNGQGAVRASALVRLCAAREALWRAQSRRHAAGGTSAERSVAEAAAELQSRKQWLHWVDHGTSIRPEADGEWGYPPDSQNSGN